LGLCQGFLAERKAGRGRQCVSSQKITHFAHCLFWVIRAFSYTHRALPEVCNVFRAGSGKLRAGIIVAEENGTVPAKINVHPQRWHEHVWLWGEELVF
jgi:hypothetical protein